MNKEELLQGITLLSQEKQVSREEVVRAYDEGASSAEGVSAPAFHMADILYYLGGGIVVIGIGIFISQHWDELNTFTRILSTLGSGMLAYFLGVVLSRRYASANTHVNAGQGFHLIAALVLPIGLFVMLDEIGVDVSGFGVISLVYFVLFGTYFVSYKLFHDILFSFVSIVFGTGLFWSMTSWLVSGTAIFSAGDFAAYQFLIIGLVYILLGHSFISKSTTPLTKYLYSFGLVFFFGAALALGGYAPDQSIFWEVIFPGLSLGAVFLSLPLRSRSFLIIGSLALVGYIFKITGEYFADSFGWPLALILAGFAMIAVGSLFVRLNREYKTLN